MSLLYNNKYDYIIYGGSISSIFASIYYKNKGCSVLLLNKYGFLGGGITECLNLVQQINFSNDISQTCGLIIDRLGKSNLINIYNDYYYINPEMLKFVLQDFVLENKIDLLFHVVPISVKEDSITLMGKEGEMELFANNILDFSDSNTLSYLINPEQKNIGIYNIVVKAKEISDIKQLFPTSKIFTISNGRYLIETILDFEDILDVEIYAHNFVNDATQKLQHKGYRIELLPAETFITNKDNNKNLFCKGIKLEKCFRDQNE